MNQTQPMTEDTLFLSTVKNGKLQLLQPENLAGTSVRLTHIQIQEAQTPESS